MTPLAPPRRALVLTRYGRLLRAAHRAGRLTAEQTLARWLHALERVR